MPNRVLICGKSGVGKKYIAGQMIGNDVTDISDVTWSIQNKYYLAEVELVIIEEPKTVIDKATYEPYQAIVILADGGSEEDILAQIDPWLNLLDQNLEAQALVINHPREGSVISRSENQTLREWAVKNCVEIISIAQGSERNPKMRAAEMGTDRLCQMLECVMWPEMTRAPAGGQISEPKKRTPAVADQNPRTKPTVHSFRPAPSPKLVAIASSSKPTTLIRNSKWDNLVDSDEDDEEGKEMEGKIDNFQSALREIMDTRDKNRKDGVSWETKLGRAERTLVKVAKALEIDDEEMGDLDQSRK